ncbi:MAG: hypothetical protein HW384_955, partial [Dehalococcoidia bacterium]|nr:hypothetical protein [Dehalococcoidia bacterium]
MPYGIADQLFRPVHAAGRGFQKYFLPSFFLGNDVHLIFFPGHVRP